MSKMKHFYKGGRGLCLLDTVEAQIPQGSSKILLMSPARYIHNQTTFLKHPVKRIVTTRTGQSSGRGKIGQIGFVLSLTILFFISLLFNNAALAQSRDTLGAVDGVGEVRPLQIGDTIPEALWSLPLQVVNHPEGKDTITLGEYKDKLIILDFWATWCSNCIKSFPKIDSLQVNNPAEFKILLVNSKNTRDNSEKVRKFLNDNIKYFNLSSIVEDTVFNKLFPHSAIPYYVWINDGKFLAISNEEDLITENINLSLTKKALQTSYVSDVPYDPQKPLFENGNGGVPTKFIYRSKLTPYINGLKRTFRTNRNKENLITRVTFTNNSLWNLYSYGYVEFSNYSFVRTVFETENTEPFSLDSTTTSWNRRNLYNYEVEFEPNTVLNAKEIVKDDLKRFFGYKITLGEREMACWILKVGDSEKIKRFSMNLTKGSPIGDVITTLENKYKNPFIDETLLSNEIKINYPSTLTPFSEFKKSLEDNGFHLTKENRKIPVIIISDN